MYVQLPEGWPTIPPIEEPQANLGTAADTAALTSRVSSPQNQVNEPRNVARNIRHSLRPKRRKTGY